MTGVQTCALPICRTQQSDLPQHPWCDVRRASCPPQPWTADRYDIKESYVVLCGKKSAYIESKDERLIKEVEKYYEEYKIVNDLTKVEDDILKVTICDFIGSEENSYTYYNDYKEKLQVSVSGQIWLDITDKGVNKGLAINKLQELLNIKHEETMVFGDYLSHAVMHRRMHQSILL